MDTKYRSKGHCKFLLRYHLILVCKYRLKLMSASNISSDIKKLSSYSIQRAAEYRNQQVYQCI